MKTINMKEDVVKYIENIDRNEDDIEKMSNKNILEIVVRLVIYLSIYLSSDVEWEPNFFNRFIVIHKRYYNSIQKRLNIKEENNL